MANQEEIIMAEVNEVLALEATVSEQLSAIKDTQDRINDFWKGVEAEMIEHDVKTIKGDWGTLTIAERLNWETTDELASKFYKKVVDTKKISDTYRLEGKAPKGATPSTTKYLTKRIKSQVVNEIVKGTSN